MEAEKHHRRIRSFVRREGKMTPGQKRALELAWPKYGLNLEDGIVSTDAIFGREAPVILEIGFGMGRSLFNLAQHHVENNYIGIEVYRPGVGALFRAMQAESIENIRVYTADAVDVLNDCIQNNSLDGVLLFFPDPWHKKRHHKRRLVQSDFIDLIHRKLKSKGYFHMATDWQHYAEHVTDVMQKAEGFKNVAGDKLYIERPDSRPVTKYEKRGERLGHGVWDMLFEKI